MTASLPKVAMDVPPALLLPPAKRYRRILEGRGGRVDSGSYGVVYVAINLATNEQAGRREAGAWGPLHGQRRQAWQPAYLGSRARLHQRAARNGLRCARVGEGVRSFRVRVCECVCVRARARVRACVCM